MQPASDHDTEDEEAGRLQTGLSQSVTFDVSTPNVARVYDHLLGGCFL